MLEGGSGQIPKLRIDEFVAPQMGKAISLFLSDNRRPYARLYYDFGRSRWVALSGEKDEVSDGSVRCFVFGQDRSGNVLVQPSIGRKLRIMRFTRDGRDVHGRLL